MSTKVEWFPSLSRMGAGKGGTMRKRFVRWLAIAAAGGALAGLAGDAAANSSAFSWTMRWRFVSGKDNKRLHALEAGELTISGKLWITDKLRGATSSPLKIQIEVLKENESKDAVCTVTVVPSTILNDKKEYSKSCGRVESGKYWLRITKPDAQDGDGDAWHNQGTGTLTTS